MLANIGCKELLMHGGQKILPVIPQLIIPITRKMKILFAQCNRILETITCCMWFASVSYSFASNYVPFPSSIFMCARRGIEHPYQRGYRQGTAHLADIGSSRHQRANINWSDRTSSCPILPTNFADFEYFQDEQPQQWRQNSVWSKETSSDRRFGERNPRAFRKIWRRRCLHQHQIPRANLRERGHLVRLPAAYI